jgi:hypothetical protein
MHGDLHCQLHRQVLLPVGAAAVDLLLTTSSRCCHYMHCYLRLQLTGELVSQQGIVLARTTRTWVPKPRALLFRVADFFVFGPWRALGLKDETIRVQLPLFEGFQNPQPPPGGWGSVAGLNPAKSAAASAAAAGECVIPTVPGMPGSSSSSKGSRVTGPEGTWGAAAADGEESVVAGPRAMWLRVTMIGRSAGYGPPRVYKAAAHLHTQLSELYEALVLQRVAVFWGVVLSCKWLCFGRLMCFAEQQHSSG